MHRNFPKAILLFLLIIIFSFAATAKDTLPNVPPTIRAPIDSLFHEPLSRGLNLVYRDRFEESIVLFDSLQQAFPDHPAPYFYRAAAYQTWMSSYRFNKFQKELEADVQFAIEIGDSLLKVRQDDPWLNFYIGAAYGYRAFFRIRRWNWIGAYRDGTRGIGNLKKALEKQGITLTIQSLKKLETENLPEAISIKLKPLLDETILGPKNFSEALKKTIGKKETKHLGDLVLEHAEKDIPIYDAYLGLGSYHYWRTARSKFIRIIAFWMRDKRDFGLEQIQFSIDHGRYCPDESYLVLVTALLDYEQYDEALAVLDRFEETTENKVMSSLYLRGRLMVHYENWPEVKSIFEELLRRLESHRYTSIGYQVECKYWIALALHKETETQAALQLANAALELSEKRDSDSELEGQFDSFKDIRKRLEKLKKKLK